MENSVIGIVVVVAIVGFVVYQSFFNKDEVVESKPSPAPAPAPAPKAPAKPKVPTAAELNKKTKAELELLARENGVELDLRKKKADLVKEARASYQQK
tara:strand:+ start:202 stop:495 length:294 start_codon:yes stop_codon:yes gene_type:complete